MTGRPGKYQPRFTGGQLDKLMSENTDEAVYFTGALLMQNARPLPQGGFTYRDGLDQIAPIRNILAAYAPNAPVLTAPAGGVAANALAGSGASLVTNALGGNASIFQIDMGAPVSISAIDLTFSVSAGSGLIEVDYSLDDANWTLLQSTQQLITTAHTRRIAAEPGAMISGRYFRVYVSALTVANPTVSLSGAAFWQESANLANVRIRSFTVSREDAYDAVFTDGNVDIYNTAGQRVGSAAQPATGAQISEMKNVQQIDTMLLFHQGFFPQQFLNEGAATEWGNQNAPFLDIPNYDFGDTTYTNGTPAQWILAFFNGLAGNHYTVTITIGDDQETTTAIEITLTSAGEAANIQAALRALPTVSQTLTCVAYDDPSVEDAVLITLNGMDGDGFAISATYVDNGNAAISASQLTVGIAGGEPLMSATRGYPACGTFYAQRTLMGGFLGAPNVVLASETGNYYELNTLLTASTAPMMIPLDTKGSATVLDIHAGRTLDFFCDSAEYWLDGATLDATATPEIVLATSNGIAPTVSAVESAGRAIYPAALGGSLFSFTFNYAIQNYDSVNLSIDRCPSLVEDVVDMVRRPLNTETNVDEIYCVCSDGSAFVFNLLEEQNIKSFAPIVTDGTFLAVNCNGQYQVSFATARTVNGQTVQFFERLTPGLLFDQAQELALDAPGTDVTGLTDLEGATVWALADFYVQGPFTVNGGVITLDFAAQNIIVGRWTPLDVQTLPQPKDIAPRTVRFRPCRVHTLRATVVDTTSIALGANGLPPFDIGLQTFGAATDQPPYENPYSGHIKIEGLDGYSDDGIAQITQLRPGLLTLTSLTVEVDL